MSNFTTDTNNSTGDKTYREKQKSARDSYQGNYSDTHAAHKLGKREAQELGCPPELYNDHKDNYRNVESFTNQVQHESMDKHLMSAHKQDRSVARFRIDYKGNRTDIPSSAFNIEIQHLRARVEQKIIGAKATGAIHSPKVFDYLKDVAEKTGVDMRTFNGIERWTEREQNQKVQEARGQHSTPATPTAQSHQSNVSDFSGVTNADYNNVASACRHYSDAENIASSCSGYGGYGGYSGYSGYGGYGGGGGYSMSYGIGGWQ